jgi:hypothetical protein
MSTKKKTALDHLVAQYGRPPKQLQHAIVPPAEWAAAMLDIGRDGEPYEVCGEYLDQRNVLHQAWDVHDVYWDWCKDEQKRRRLIFLKWMYKVEDEDITRPALRAMQITGNGKGKEPTFLGWVDGPLGQARTITTNPLRDLALKAEKWPPTMWTLAEAVFPGLRLPPDPYKRGPTGAAAAAARAKKNARLQKSTPPK